MIVYKAVAVDERGKMYSAWTVQFKDVWPELVVEYELGEESVAKVGYIMAFEREIQARTFINYSCMDSGYDYNYTFKYTFKVLACEGIPVNHMALRFMRLCNVTGYVKVPAIRRFWETAYLPKRVIDMEHTQDLPLGTVLVNRLIPIRVVKVRGER